MSISPPAMTARGTRYIVLFIGLVAAAIILWRISDVVVVTFGGIIGAVILRALAEPLARHTRMSETWSLTLTVAALIAAFVGLGWFFGDQTANQFGEMQRLIPEALTQLSNTLQKSSGGRAIIDAIKHASADTKFLSGMGTAAGMVLGGLTEASLVVFLSIYFAFDPMEYFDGILRLVPPANRNRVSEALLDASQTLRKWLVAQLYAMIIVGFLAGISLAVLRVPLAFLLGVIAGLLEFIPVLGPVLFTVPAVLVAFTRSPATVGYVIAVYFCLQQLESNIITPLFQKRAIRLPPALTLLSVVIGGILLGPSGAVFGIPLAVAALTVVKHLYVENTLERSNHRSPTPPAVELSIQF